MSDEEVIFLMYKDKINVARIAYMDNKAVNHYDMRCNFQNKKIGKMRLLTFTHKKATLTSNGQRE